MVELGACESPNPKSPSKGHEELDMYDITDGQPDHIEFAEIHDILGWDNFVEGRISKRLVHLQAKYLSTIQTFVQPSSWASGLMRQLLLLTHQHAMASLQL